VRVRVYRRNCTNPYSWILCHEQFIFRMYSIALVAISAAAAVKGDLQEGLRWMAQPGTYNELDLPIDQRTWSVPGKIAVMVIFSSMGFFGSSCSAAITKNFGALTMSITSTARKATTLFLSFFLFNNVCTSEHLAGIVIFITALTTKSLRRGRKSKKKGRKKKTTPQSAIKKDSDLEFKAEIPFLRRSPSNDGTPSMRRPLLDSSGSPPPSPRNPYRGIHVV